MFGCGVCKAMRLSIGDVVDLGYGDDDDERQLQMLSCAACKLEAIGVYTADTHGSHDSFRHGAYRASPERIAQLRARIAACPSPRNKMCTCASHVELRRTFESYRSGVSFAMER